MSLGVSLSIPVVYIPFAMYVAGGVTVYTSRISTLCMLLGMSPFISVVHIPCAVYVTGGVTVYVSSTKGAAHAVIFTPHGHTGGEGC